LQVVDLALDTWQASLWENCRRVLGRRSPEPCPRSLPSVQEIPDHTADVYRYSVNQSINHSTWVWENCFKVRQC